MENDIERKEAAPEAAISLPTSYHAFPDGKVPGPAG